MKISSRLLKVASLIKARESMADIGTDHGYVPIYLATNGLIKKAIAMDVNEGPLLRATQNIQKYNVSDIVSTRLSDGLAGLVEGEAESILIAGMGGLLINRILEDGLNKAKTADELILSPHSDVDAVREYVLSNGFMISDEMLIYDEGKYYFALRCVPGEETDYSEAELLYGRRNIEQRTDLFVEYLSNEEVLYTRIWENLSRSDSNDARKQAVAGRLEIIKRLLDNK